MMEWLSALVGSGLPLAIIGKQGKRSGASSGCRLVMPTARGFGQRDVPSDERSLL
jgi:hypothetical protein